MNEDNRTLYIVGGVNGAGKSTFIDERFKDCGIKILNFDSMAYEINGDYSWRSYLKASEEICKLLNYWSKTGKSLVWETLLTSNSYIERIDNFRKYGYKIDITYIFLKDKETHTDRINKRVKNGGHNIYPEMLDIYYENRKKFLGSAIENSDSWRILCNQNTQFEKVISGNNDQIVISNSELLNIFENQAQQNLKNSLFSLVNTR
ncbi:MAG: AAA family ATPase [Alphaproteobacteria bacterium]|nr:AAA family ATPase [Alphaproteobacteria bacterium]MBN2675424.1 AAA family ATPase [Alphaproteobacteria bacterium]